MSFALFCYCSKPCSRVDTTSNALHGQSSIFTLFTNMAAGRRLYPAVLSPACCDSYVYSVHLCSNVVRPWRLRGLPYSSAHCILSFFLHTVMFNVHYWLFFFYFCNKVFFDSYLAALPLLHRFCCWITNIWLILNTWSPFCHNGWSNMKAYL